MQRGVVTWVALLAVFVVVASVLFAWSAPSDGLAVAMTAIGISTAAAAVGGLIGWIFGIPRTRDESRTEAAPSSMHYFANTNLAKVSDWLTTILIGLGLVQLGRLIPAARTFADALEEPLGGSPGAGAFGLALVAVSGIAGCLLAYLWTAVRLRELLERCEDDACRDSLRKRTNAFHQHTEALRQDTEALREDTVALIEREEAAARHPDSLTPPDQSRAA